jgi:uncharacterized repeat protein (TIGR01451 family)
VNIDTTTPSNSLLACFFRGTSLPLSLGGACRFENNLYVVDFAKRSLLSFNGSSYLTCTRATISAKTDLAISKTDGSASAVPGTTTTYTIVVSNGGPNAVTGASVADTFPTAISADTYTSLAAGGATGNTATGSGAIADSLDLPVGASVTYTVVATVDPAALGSLANTATVTAPAGTIDTNPANNSATDTDTLTPVADMSVTKTDGVAFVFVGNGTTYTIVVANAGPSSAQVVLTDLLNGNANPPVGSGSWTATNGHSGTGTTGLADLLSLAPGASVTYTYTLAGIAGPHGTLTNFALLSAFGATDPNPANDIANDTDAVFSPPA